MKPILILLSAAILCCAAFGSFAGDAKNINLVPQKFRSVPSFNRNGRGVTVKVSPGKSYLIRAAVKLNAASTNPDTKIRIAVRETGVRAIKFFEWHRINATEFTNLSAMYKVSPKVTEAYVILNPRFTAEEKATYKDFAVIEVDEELDE